MIKVIAFVAAVLIGVDAFAAPLDSVPESGKLSFAIWREGARIGTHSFTFRRDGNAVIVDGRVDVTVSFAFVTLYRYSGTRNEVWRNGRLVSYTADTDDNGTPVHVRGHADDKGFSVTGKAGTVTLPAKAMPFTMWSRGVVEGGALFGMDDGVPLTVKVEALGGSPVEHFHVTGDVDYEMSFAGPFLRAVRIKARDGSTVEYMPE